MTSRLQSVARALVVLLAIVGVATAWAVNSPVGASPDEPTHIIHAYAVATGQTLPGRETIRVDDRGVFLTEVLAPTGVRAYEDIGCYLGQPAETPTCGLLDDGDPTGQLTTMPSYMTRYPPLYYLGAGLVIRGLLAFEVAPETTLLVTRVVSGVGCLTFVVIAAAVLRRRFTGPGPGLMVLAALTPVSLSLFSAVNPNGAEVAAAVLTAALVCAIREDLRRDGRVGAGLLAGFVVALTVLTWSRPLSLVWGGLLLGVLLLPGGLLPAGGLRALARQRARLVTLAVSLACLAAAALWLLYATQTRAFGDEDDEADWSDYSLVVKVVMVAAKFGDLVHQMIAMMGSDTTLPLVLVLAWCLTTVVAVSVLATGGSRASTSLRHVGLLVAGSVLAVGGYSVLTAFGWQGRYWLPIVAAALVLCVPSLQGGHLPAAARRRLAVVTAAVLLAVQLAAFVWHLWRYVYGVDSLYRRFSALPRPDDVVGWLPPIGLPLTVALLLAGSAGLLWLLLGPWPGRVARTAAGPDRSPDRVAAAPL